MTDTLTPPPEQRETRPPSQGRALARLALIVVAGLVAAYITGVTSTVLVVGAIIAMIMLHELGHFMTAKWADMKVTEYFLGFGPRLWSIRKGETEYGVKAIPAGGYVKIIGMSSMDKVDPADEPRTYRQKSYGRRMSVAVAGSTVHFMIAFVLLLVLYGVVGVPNYSKPFSVGTISRLESGPSPAAEAGFKLGDTVLAVDGKKVTWEDVPPYIRTRPGKPVVFDVLRDGKRLQLTATPVDLSKVVVEGDHAPVSTTPRGFVGIGDPKFPTHRLGPVGTVTHSVTGLGRATVETLKALGTIFSPSGATSYSKQLLNRPQPTNGDDNGGNNRFLSPVGFVRVASQAADTGWREVLTLLLSINIFVGIFNMIPLLPLDGGHVAIATYERLRSRRGQRYYVDIAKVMPLTYMVVLLLAFIAISSLYLDIVHPIANPFQ
ncbi:MAG TPA: RIP metalloprotease [Acidimicrobiales bacterium]|nr:RIP metalloprotease [Acidimicrobiales bacterium]